MVVQSVSEILKESELIPARAEKIAFFRDKHRNNQPVRTYLRCAFDPNLKFLLPKGMPDDYKDSSFGDVQGVIYSRIRELYLFIEGGHPTLKQDKRELLFRRFLESIDKEDAELLCMVKDKFMPYRGIDYALVAAAYPGLLPVVIGMKSEVSETIQEVIPPNNLDIVTGPATVSDDELDNVILGEQTQVVVEGLNSEEETEKKVDTTPDLEVKKRGRPKNKPKE